MKYLLDSNICIHYFRDKFDIDKKLQNIGLKNCAISEITLAELIVGAEKSNNPTKNHRIIEIFATQLTVLPIFGVIQFYAKEKVRLQKQGNMVSDFDLLIGATAIQNNMIMVTENVKEFKRIKNIKIENRVLR